MHSDSFAVTFSPPPRVSGGLLQPPAHYNGMIPFVPSVGSVSSVLVHVTFLYQFPWLKRAVKSDQLQKRDFTLDLITFSDGSCLDDV